MNPREQGDIGELSAMQWLATIGAKIYLPLGHSPHCDFVADMHGRLLRVQVKTCAFGRREDRWGVAVCTRGGNQSWNGLVKRLDPSRYDFLFVHVGDGRRWFIPSQAVHGQTQISLGGPKYGEFEVDRGDPLPGPASTKPASTIGIPSSGGCPSG